MKTLVIGMGVLIVVGFAVLVALIVGRIVHSRNTAAHPFAAAPVEIPAGAHVETMAVGTDRLMLDLVLPDGTREILVLDPATGARLGTILLRSAK